MLPVELKNTLVLDIETVCGAPALSQMPEALQELWAKKSEKLNLPEEMSPEESFYERGAIYSEFGKIVCISLGFFYEDEDGKPALRVKALFDHDEADLLFHFAEMLKTKFPSNVRFVAHNGKEFDYPYIARRMLIHGIKLPHCLDMRGKKPWEVQHLDTMELWKFGDRKAFTSLALLAGVFGFPTSKDDIDGSQVTSVYYEENDLGRIARYCNKDVVLTAQIYLRLIQLAPLAEQQIQIVAD